MLGALHQSNQCARACADKCSIFSISIWFCFWLGHFFFVFVIDSSSSRIHPRPKLSALCKFANLLTMRVSFVWVYHIRMYDQHLCPSIYVNRDDWFLECEWLVNIYLLSDWHSFLWPSQWIVHTAISIAAHYMLNSKFISIISVVGLSFFFLEKKCCIIYTIITLRKGVEICNCARCRHWFSLSRALTRSVLCLTGSHPIIFHTIKNIYLAYTLINRFSYAWLLYIYLLIDGINSMKSIVMLKLFYVKKRKFVLYLKW